MTPAVAGSHLELSEAKRVPSPESRVELSETKLVPPPRTIGDITAILEQQKLVDPKSIEKAKKTAREEPPSGAKGEKLAEFYWKRGLAAGKIGDIRRQISDLKEAEHLYRPNDRTRMAILWDLGIAETYAGNYADAIRHREASLAIAPEKHGVRVTRTAILASLYATSGNLDAAARLLSLAESNFKKARGWRGFKKFHTTWIRGLRWAQGRVEYSKGRYREAENRLREALTASNKELKKNILDKKYAATAHDLIRVDIARALIRQNRLVEAEIMVRKALTNSLGRLGRYSPDTAYMLKWLANVLDEQGRHDEAEQLVRAVIDIYLRIGAPNDSLMLADARRQLAETLVLRREWRQAFSVFEEIQRGLEHDPATFERFFGTNLSWALTLLRVGDTEKAHELASAAFTLNKGLMGAKHYDTAEALGFSGITLASLDRKEAALEAFAQAMPFLLSSSRESLDESTTKVARDARLEVVLEAYLKILYEIRGTTLEERAGFEAGAEAFRIADFVRSKSVQGAISAMGARAAARDPRLAELARQEQDARKRIGALFGLLANISSLPSDRQNSKAIRALRREIDENRDQRGQLADQIQETFPEYWNLLSPRPTSVDQARDSLKPGETLIATYVGEEHTYIWAVSHDGQVDFESAQKGRRQIQELVAAIRDSVEPQSSDVDEIPQFDLGAAHELYSILLEPVRASWRETKTLLVVAHDSLGQLPFALLPTEPYQMNAVDGPLFASYRRVPWLVRTHAVMSLPTVASLKTLRRLPSGDESRRPFLGFGDPWFVALETASARDPAADPLDNSLALENRAVSLRKLSDFRGIASADLADLAPLPDTADEIRGMATAMGADLKNDVFLGSAASESRIKTMSLDRYKVIAFATHGLVPGDLDGLLQPALALSSPDVTGEGGDGLLTMGEILELRLDADWVVLSACNTAAGDGGGAAAISGLGRAFFYAGARSLLVSSWPVETTSAKALTTGIFELHTSEPDIDRAEALRRTMLSLIDEGGLGRSQSGEILLSYAHPLFWAPFMLVGDGG